MLRLNFLVGIAEATATDLDDDADTAVANDA